MVQPDLICRLDFPAPSQYLPDLYVQKMINGSSRKCAEPDDLLANALLLTRATGIRIGECIQLALDCLRQLAEDQWALHAEPAFGRNRRTQACPRRKAAHRTSGSGS